MSKVLRHIVVALALGVWSVPAFAQSADEIVEKHLAALGGREALDALTSRVSRGTISLTTPAGVIEGTVTVHAKAPDRNRTVIQLDLSAFGAPNATIDQRFDGTNGYVLDSINGDREMTGSTLDAMRFGGFPTPLFDYKGRGGTVTLIGREPLGDGEAYLLEATQASGASARFFIDADSFRIVRAVIPIDVPELGGPIDQVVEFSDYREVDGVLVAHVNVSTNVAQTVTATLTAVTHNVEIEDADFRRPD